MHATLELDVRWWDNKVIMNMKSALEEYNREERLNLDISVHYFAIFILYLFFIRFLHSSKSGFDVNDSLNLLSELFLCAYICMRDYKVFLENMN